MTKHICSACGHLDNELDPFERDGWLFCIDNVSYGGINVALSPQQFRILRGIALSAHTVSVKQLNALACSEAFPESVKAQLTHIRNRLRNLNIHVPFVSVWGYGYKWQVLS